MGFANFPQPQLLLSAEHIVGGEELLEEFGKGWLLEPAYWVLDLVIG